MSHPVNPKVIDISHYDNVTSFDDIKNAGIVGIINKATQGIGSSDNTYAIRRPKALASGLLWGAYHFGTNDDPVAQAEHFLAVAQPDDTTLVCLDWEPSKDANHNDNTMSLSQAKTFLQTIESKLGRKAVLYTGSLSKDTLGNSTDSYLASHRLWLSQYGPNPVPQASWKTVWLWQYTGDDIGPQPHSISGVQNTGIDINSYDFSDDQLKSEWSGVTAVAQVQEPVVTTPAPTVESNPVPQVTEPDLNLQDTSGNMFTPVYNAFKGWFGSKN